MLSVWASVVNYNCKEDQSDIFIYNHKMFIIQATGVQVLQNPLKNIDIILFDDNIIQITILFLSLHTNLNNQRSNCFMSARQRSRCIKLCGENELSFLMKKRMLVACCVLIPRKCVTQDVNASAYQMSKFLFSNFNTIICNWNTRGHH